jgi:predicted O-linked N-acetylglucosamine transferase (SPINDLY family)
MAGISEALATALAHHQAGRLDLAEEIYRRILAVEPMHPDALHLLGMVLYRTGQPDAAIEHIQRAISIYPEHGDFYNNLGGILQEMGRSEEAIDCYRQGLAVSPQSADLHYNLGNAWRALHDLPQAIACYQQALQLDPFAGQTHNNLGSALRALGELDAATNCYRRALELSPGDARFLNNLGDIAQLQGRAAEAVAWYRQAIAAQPDFRAAHGNLLLALEYQGADLPELAQAYAEFDRRQGVPLRSTWQPHPNTRDPRRPLRLGFVAADFRHHPVGYSFLRALESLAQEDCRVVCYANQCCPADAFTARFQAAAHEWHNVIGLTDDALAAQIRADQIDILFDLCGHFEGTRLGVFARRPAPIQIAWTGPTGLSAIDYLLADRHLVPEDAQTYSPERVLRLPDAYTCFEPPPEASPVGPLPAAERGQLTFGNLNNLAKISPQAIAIWAEILQRLPASRLLLRQMFSTTGDNARRRLLDQFAQQGIDARRVEVAGRAPYAQRLDLYQQIDIALDPFPFSGATTTYEALWMGVPVVSYPGVGYYRRMSLPHLAHAGLDDLVATDPADYVRRAVQLAQDLPRLAALRAALRPRLAASPLYDGPRLARQLLALVRNLWREWCQNASLRP